MTDPTATKDPIQVPSSEEIEKVEFSYINLGRTGEVHPRVVPAIIKSMLAVKIKICYN